MSESGFQGNRIVRIILGIVAAGAAGLFVAAAYLMLMRQVMGTGRGMDGLALAASLLVFPVASALMTTVIWLPFTLWRHGRNRPVNAMTAIGVGALVGLAIGFVFSGPGGFKLTGGAPAFNYAFAALGCLGALAFHGVTRKAVSRS